MNNSFSIKRLWAFSCAEIGAQRRALIINFAVLSGLMILFYLISFSTNMISPIEFEPLKFEGTHRICIFMISISMIVYVAGIFIKYHRGREASAAMLLPISKGEKFTYALLFSMMAVPLALCLIDFVIFHMMSFVWGVSSEVRYLGWQYTTAGSLINASIGSVAIMSTFFLGAVIFRRRQLLYTIITQATISISFVLSMIAYYNITGSNGWDFPNSALWIRWSLFAVFTALMIFLAWWRFKKLQIK